MAESGKSDIEYLSVWPPEISSTSSKNNIIQDNEGKNEEPFQKIQRLDTDIESNMSYKHINNEKDNNSACLNAETILAIWWRRRTQETPNCSKTKDVLDMEQQICKITCPRAKINAIKKHPLARLFLANKARSLVLQYDLCPKQHYLISTIYFTSAFLEDYEELEDQNKNSLKFLDKAQFHIDKCISRISFCKLQDLKTLSNLDYLNTLNDLNDFQKEVLAYSVKLELQIQAVNPSRLKPFHQSIAAHDLETESNVEERKSGSISPSLVAQPVTPTKVIVDRRSYDDLSVEEFLNHYCKQSKPLVITGLEEKNIVSNPWSLDHIAEIAGSQKVTLKKSTKDSIKWAKLEPSVETSVDDFITSVKLGTSGENYLFDWSLPLFSPRLHAEIKVPKYFKHDYLKKTSVDALYRNSWPSLFLSAKGSVSKLHVDAFGSNFWMYLFKGRKKWTFFPKDITNSLRPKYYESLDPVFELDLNNGSIPEATKNQACEVILDAGELLFVPYGSPHQVENLEDSLAISSNFVDESNIHCVVNHLRANALQDPRSGDLLKEFIALGLT